MNSVLIKFVKFYQLTFSPFLGQHCRFTPTCSNYAIEALRNHGSIKGTGLAIKRICRCHPWAHGGIDEVPK
tara:strand:- start:168 stop:380 length:213 start_codon:yes stop_codon:yes gene_type:complete